MKLKPLQDRIIVEPFEVESQTKGGLIIPDSVKEKPIKGVVKKVGIGKCCQFCGKGDQMELLVGDTVLFGKGAGMEIEEGGKKYLLMKESDVLMKDV